MSERLKFIEAVARRDASFAELCERYGISRKTGYIWWRRFEEMGLAGLEDRSRRPLQSPQATSKRVVQLIRKERERRPRRGPKKILAALALKYPQLQLPALSTVARILKREGLIKRRRRRGRPARLLQTVDGWGTTPNELWTADHKGQFRLRDGTLCYPLTIADSCSRFVLRITACTSTSHEQAQPVFESAFREYGLPERMLTDNGTPFGTTAIIGLSKLAVWWLKLGIRVERIEPGRPEQNAQHERMHRTLKEEGTQPARAHRRAQQRCFDAFRREFNTERPHEALHQRTPADRYESSLRRLTKETPGLDYPLYFDRRQVRTNGSIKWRGQDVFISEVLAAEPVGLEEHDDGVWKVHFGPIVLGAIHDGEPRLRRASPAGSRRRAKEEVLPMS